MFGFRKNIVAGGEPLRGVNLGGWLVLEKWMTPSLFEGTDAVDEYTYCRDAGQEELQRLTRHRDSFITESDFAWLKQRGIQAVRLPVGSWMFGGEGPYQQTVAYVDRAFSWAQKHGIKVLLSMHGAPGSQNGQDHSGRAGATLWHTDNAHIVGTLEALRNIAERYGKHPQLLGISLLNEPKATMPKRPLLNFYKAAYALIRDMCGSDVWVVYSDGFRPWRWRRVLKGRGFTNVYIDTHSYQCFSGRDKRHGIAWHLKKATHAVPRALGRMLRHHPVVVGEWSLTLSRESVGRLDAAQDDAVKRAYAAAQLLAFSRTQAWFFWSYKTEHGGTWSLRDCLAKGWLPDWSKLKNT